MSKRTAKKIVRWGNHSMRHPMPRGSTYRRALRIVNREGKRRHNGFNNEPARYGRWDPGPDLGRWLPSQQRVAHP